MESGDNNITNPPPSEEPELAGPSIVDPATPAAEERSSEPYFSPPAVSELVPLTPVPDLPGEAQDQKPSQAAVSRRMIFLASAGAGLVLLGTYLAHRGAKAEAPVRAPAIVEHLDFSELSALPQELQPGAQALMAGKYQLPAWFQTLERPSGGDLEYPVQEAVEEVQPTLRWISSAASTHVAVLSPAHEVVARTEIYSENRWTVPTELARGTVYLWEVVSPGQVRRNSFRVLDENEAGWMAGLRLVHGQSHLVMGVASLELGMLTAAQREFQALAQEHPHSPEAAQLLRTVNGLLAR